MATESTIVEVRNVTKRFVLRKEKTLKDRLLNFSSSNLHKDDFYALRDVSLDIEAGTTVGLIGPNGSGKSTLLKTIGGILRPTSGSVRRRGRMAALLELGAGFHPDLTGRENVYLNAAILGLSRAETDFYFDDIVEFSGIPEFIDTQVKFYSSGMYVRLAFAVAVHVNPDFLIVDEVLAVGDEPFQRKCLDRIRQFQTEGKTIILVSHALEQVAELCSRVVVLEHGSIVFDGDPATGIKVLRDGFQTSREEDESAASPRTPQARILSAEVTNSAQSASSSDFSALSDLHVKVAYELSDSIDELSCDLELETPLGHRVFATSTRALGIPLSSDSGQHELVYELQHVALGTGTYAVNLALNSRVSGELTRASGITHFSISAAANQSGSTFIQASAHQLS